METELNITKAIDYRWTDYDKVVGECQLANYGVIFLDTYNCPIDNEYELERLYEEYIKRGN